MVYPMTSTATISEPEEEYLLPDFVPGFNLNERIRNPVTGWLRDERTGIYSWIDPITKNIVKGKVPPNLAERRPEIQEEITRRGLTNFIVDKEGRVLSEPEYKYVTWQQKQTENVREDITDPYIILDKKIETIKQAKMLDYQLIKSQIDPANQVLHAYLDNSVMRELNEIDLYGKQKRITFDAIMQDPDFNDEEKQKAASMELAPPKFRSPVSIIGVTNIPALQQQQQRQKQQLLTQQENAPLNDEELQLALQLKIELEDLNERPYSPAEIRQKIRIAKLKQTPSGMGMPSTPGGLPPTIMGPGKEYDMLPIGAAYYDNKGNLWRK